MSEERASAGRLDRRIVAALLGLEIKLLMRDKRTIIFAVVLPLIVFPVIILIMRYTERSGREKLERATYTYAVTGSQAERARELIAAALALEPEGNDSVPGAFEEKTVEAPDSLLRAGELHLVVLALSAEEARAELEEEAAEDSSAAKRLAELVDVPLIELAFRSNSEVSNAARRRLQNRLNRVRVAQRDNLLRERGLPVPPQDFAKFDTRNLASAEKEGGASLGRFLTLMLVLLMLTGGSVVAADAISGEKERGTLETLLTTAASRREVVWAKLLAIFVVSIAITLINVANLAVYVASGLFDLPAGFAVKVSPLGVLAILLLYLPLAALVASALLLVSGFSKTYKEYQIYFFPVLLMFALPAAAAILPGLDLRSAVVAAPVANVSVAVREILIGEYDWLFLGLAFAVTCGAAIYTGRLTEKTLSTERLITAAELERADIVGGPELFEKRVLRWFAVAWATLFVVSLWFGAELGVRRQIALNLLGIFLSLSLLMIWRFRLVPREALALRPVKAPVWLAVLIGAPSALVVGQGVFRVANYVFPVPERLLESFGQSLLPPDLQLWELLLFLAVLPGVIEEIAFRGLLLHGLRRKFHPVVLCLVVGAIFGFFHVDLFRVIPTGFLGVVLAAVVVLTGSIFPAMLWHALNNAVALVPAYYGVIEDLPVWSFPVGLVGLALAFWIIWANRSVYPGLRT